MILEINPHQSVGGILFGASQEAVGRVLGDNFTVFVRNPNVPYKEHAYDELGVYVSFDRAMKCNAVLIMKPSDAVLNRKLLLALAAQEAFEVIRSLDSASELEGGSLTSARLGIAVYAPDIEAEPEDPPESVLVFRADYFKWNQATHE
ncbi:MAG: hypothetical protein H7A47_15435 [Verrucomicrobiales bacterium]|nr:hypothetical protein [Verrucomicrobiales bacterium]